MSKRKTSPTTSKIKDGKQNYIESSEKLGVDPRVARRRADKWEKAMEKRVSRPDDNDS